MASDCLSPGAARPSAASLDRIVCAHSRLVPLPFMGGARWPPGRDRAPYPPVHAAASVPPKEESRAQVSGAALPGSSCLPREAITPLWQTPQRAPPELVPSPPQLRWAAVALGSPGLWPTRGQGALESPSCISHVGRGERGEPRAWSPHPAPLEPCCGRERAGVLGLLPGGEGKGHCGAPPQVRAHGCALRKGPSAASSSLQAACRRSRSRDWEPVSEQRLSRPGRGPLLRLQWDWHSAVPEQQVAVRQPVGGKGQGSSGPSFARMGLRVRGARGAAPQEQGQPAPAWVELGRGTGPRDWAEHLKACHCSLCSSPCPSSPAGKARHGDPRVGCNEVVLWRLTSWLLLQGLGQQCPVWSWPSTPAFLGNPRVWDPAEPLSSPLD